MIFHTGLYIHFPYCDIKCHYCDFFSLEHDTMPKNFYNNYLVHLKNDLLAKKLFIQPNYLITTIFLGGGTPSKVPADILQELLSFCQHNLNVCNQIEITIEVNPESTTLSKLQAYRDMGINRIHVGIQTRVPELLAYIGRPYHMDSYINIMPNIRKAGFQNFGVDFIYGIPGQKISHLREDIQWAIDNQVTHVSAYCLSVERNTQLTKRIHNKEINNISERRQAFHFDFVISILKQHGFNHYEISNFCKNNFLSRHNMLYWKYRPYVGIGVSSHSFLGQYRLISKRDLNNYMNGDYFFVEETKVIPNILIGILRLLSFQSFRSLRKFMSATLIEQLKMHLKPYANKQWININEKGFQITEIGISFQNTMLEEITEAFSKTSVV